MVDPEEVPSGRKGLKIEHLKHSQVKKRHTSLAIGPTLLNDYTVYYFITAKLPFTPMTAPAYSILVHDSAICTSS